MSDHMPALKRSRLGDTEATFDGTDVSGDEHMGSDDDEYESSGIDDGPLDNEDTATLHRVVDNGAPTSSGHSEDSEDSEDPEDSEDSEDPEAAAACERVWGFTAAVTGSAAIGRLEHAAEDAVAEAFLQVHYGLTRWAEGQGDPHAYAMAMLLDCCDMEAGFCTAQTLDALRAHLELFRQKLERRCPGPFLNDAGDEVAWDDFSERVVQVVDILAEMLATPSVRNERVEGDKSELGMHRHTRELLIKHMKKLNLYVTMGDRVVWQKVQGNAKFVKYVTGQDHDLGRGVFDFPMFLRRLRGSCQVRVKQHNPDLYELAGALSRNLSETFVSEVTKFFLEGEGSNSRVLRKRVNFIRYSDFGLDQHTMRVYSEDEIGAEWMPSWSYLDTRFRDVAFPLEDLRDVEGFAARYKIEDTVSNFAAPKREEARATRVRHRKEQHRLRLQAAEEHPQLLVRCDSGVPDASGADEWVIWPPGSRHLLRIFEDQGWPVFGIQLRLVLLARNFFWNFIEQVEIEEMERCLCKKGPYMGTGGDSSAAVAVDFGESGTGKSTLVTFLNKVNGSMCKSIRAQGNNPEFFAGQVAQGATLNLVMDELSVDCEFPTHDFLQMSSGQEAHANIKNQPELKEIKWIYAITMMCNYGQFPRSLTDDLTRLRRRIWPFDYAVKFEKEGQADEQLTRKIEQNVGQIHLEVLMQRRIYHLDCTETLGLSVPNYTKWVHARDTTGFIQSCRIKFFGGFKEKAFVNVFRQQSFEYGSEFYTLVDDPTQLRGAEYDEYKLGLLQHVRQVYEAAFDEQLSDTGSHDDAHRGALEQLRQCGFDFKERPTLHRADVFENVTIDSIAFVVRSMPDYASSRSGREVFADHMKWDQAANIYFAEDVHVAKCTREWPPGSALELHAQYLVGCAPKASHGFYTQGARVDEHRARVLVGSLAGDFWRYECTLTSSALHWLRDWHLRQDLVTRARYADFEKHTSGMARLLNPSDQWSRDFADAERFVLVLE